MSLYEENDDFQIFEEADVPRACDRLVHVVYCHKWISQILSDLVSSPVLKDNIPIPRTRKDAIAAIIITEAENFSVYRVFVTKTNQAKIKNMEMLDCAVWSYSGVPVQNPYESEEDLKEYLAPIIGPDEELIELEPWQCKTFGLYHLFSYRKD